MCWVDKAVENEERDLALCLKVRKPAGPVPREDGLCLNGCGDPVMQGGAFCSAECAQDWQHRLTMRARSGRVDG